MELLTYEIYEDNGGGLTMFVFENKKMIYAYSGIEYDYIDIFEMLEDIEDCESWDNNLVENEEIDHEELYKQLTDTSVLGSELIAENGEFYFDRMGSAGLTKFKKILPEKYLECFR